MPVTYQQNMKTSDHVKILIARYGLVVALGLICGYLSFKTENFLSHGNLVMVLRQISINGILAVGVTYVLLTGGVDLSLGSVLALAGVVAALFAQQSQLPVLLPVLMGLLAGTGCGLINGAVITKGRVAPFITTLGMMTAARGLALVFSEGKPVSKLTPAFLHIAGGDCLWIPLPILVFTLVSVISWVLLQNTRPGRYIYAVGGNENAARAAGINVHVIKIFAYTICGALAGLAGVIQASRSTTGQPNAGIGYELDAIAAVVIGGTSLSGGVGGIGGTILGALLMGVIDTGLDQMGVSPYYQQIIKGAIIVGAVWLDRWNRK
jgi:inositol transport system permease protein